MLYKAKFHTSIEINDSTNLYTQLVRKSSVSVNESTARLVHESTALPQEICILFTEHSFLLRTWWSSVFYNVQPLVSNVLSGRASGTRKDFMRYAYLSEDLLHIWHINSILNVKVSAPSQWSYGLQNLLCHGTTRTYIKLNACAERRNVNGGAFLAVAKKNVEQLAR